MDFKISENYAGLTVKEYLFDVLGFSSGAVKRVKYRENGITVNSERVTVRKVLSEGDILSLASEDRKEDENVYTVPTPLDIGIAYEDSYITVVDKPPKMPTHPSLGHKNDTVANALAWRYREAPFVFRPVNRLDCDTSGLMIVARDNVSAGKMYSSMIKGEIKKRYIAILDGVPSEKAGQIDTYVCREGGSIVKRKVCRSDEPSGKRAITDYRVIVENGKSSVVEAVPVTGRTHQLRLHFASLGCPIAGDTMYGKKNNLIDRQALHSRRLSFVHPESKEKISVFSPLPCDMIHLAKELGFEEIEKFLAVFDETTSENF